VRVFGLKIMGLHTILAAIFINKKSFPTTKVHTNCHYSTVQY